MMRKGLFGKSLGTKQPFSFFGDHLGQIPPLWTPNDMEVQSLEERQTPSSPGRERSLKRPRVDEDQEDGDEVPTEDCDKHPTLYLEDGNVVLRCEE